MCSTCDYCGSDEGVERVIWSDGTGSWSNHLCARCEAEEVAALEGGSSSTDDLTFGGMENA